MIDISFAHWLVVASLALGIVGAYAYMRDVVSGKAKPNRVSWGLWAIAPLIGTGAALSAGADLWVTARVFLAGCIPLTVFMLSFFTEKSQWKIDSFDIVCGFFALLAIGTWLFADSFKTAILFSALAQIFASFPTIRKAWHFPETESGFIFVMGLCGVLLIIPSIPVWNVENAGFQVTLLVINVILITAVYRKRVLGFFA